MTNSQNPPPAARAMGETGAPSERVEGYSKPASNYNVETNLIPSPAHRVEAEARLSRVMRLGRQVKWSGYGEPAISDPDTKSALIELFEIWCVDALDRGSTAGGTEQMRGVDIPRLPVGTPVIKVLGYQFPGTVVAAFHTLSGQERFVVEANGDGYRGMLHIFRGDQLRAALATEGSTDGR